MAGAGYVGVELAAGLAEARGISSTFELDMRQQVNFLEQRPRKLSKKAVPGSNSSWPLRRIAGLQPKAMLRKV